MSSPYASVKAQFSTLPAFTPPVPTALLPYIAFFTLLTFFILSFMFTTLPRSKNIVPELGTAAIATFAAIARAQASQVFLPGSADSLEWISRNFSLPKVIIYSTGGTILAASTYSRLDNLAYGEHQTHPPTARTLIDEVDEVLDIAQVAIVTLPPRISNDLTSQYFVNISRHFSIHACRADSDIAGAIVLHGTSTLAETIFGIDLTLPCSKPIVAVGSMRPQRALSSDAYLNFYQAISTAISPSSRGRGALIVGNDHITSAFFGTKAHANNPDTFMALEQGHLGYLFAGQPYYFYDAARPTGKQFFDLSQVEGDLPQVDILYGHIEFDADLMYASVKLGSRGIVIVGMGAGDLNAAGDVAAEELALRGIPVIVSARPYTGSSFPRPHPDSKFKTNCMSAEHARIQLQLCLATGMKMEAIREAFEGPFRRAVYNEATRFYYPAR
ncbi:Asparaginase/glutaminase [Dioszegia hungarica]|uniref:asparaginase n=1 Tax=Dioszegia hungarica TaxID=4972 RepID=A0AA38H9D0_9TREE|nr:Asparaginase/glutaminase [Dioszegia hungarica]KAI9636685.1 Asparaginase/glutaminase [Dioszegia hungarica]